jgi:hypothetical protein
VAQNHYLQVTMPTFAQAILEPVKNPNSAAQNQAQSAAVTTGIDEDSTQATNENHPVLPSDSD